MFDIVLNTHLNITIKQLTRASSAFFPQRYNPLNVKPSKWSNTLKQIVGSYRQIVLVCLTILRGWCLKG